MIVPKLFRGSIITKKGIEDVILQAIAPEEAKDKKFVGSAYGTDIFHCWYLSRRHGGEQASHARWYVVREDPNDAHLEKMRHEQPSTIKVDFFRPHAEDEPRNTRKAEGEK